MSSLFSKSKKDKKSENIKIDSTKMDDREESFRNNSIRWPSSLPAPDSMADAGFYFTPNDKYADCCTCYRCGIKMYNWLPDDTPKVEHKKFSPSCKEAKSWTDISNDDLERGKVNRPEQTESQSGLRSKITDKAKKLTGALHRRSEGSKQSQPLPSLSKEAPNSKSSYSETRELDDEEKLASVVRQRETAEKALEGLEKLASFYPPGSSERNLAQQSITAQTADLEKLRQDEMDLVSKVGTLSFARGWNAPAASQAARDEEDSPPANRGRSASMRALPMLPSQRKDSVRVPAHVGRAVTSPSPIRREEVPSYEQYQSSKVDSPIVQSKSAANEEWIEYFTDAGVPYYYNTISKTTVWEIPSAPQSQDRLTSVTSN